jgi:hypothetical protein
VAGRMRVYSGISVRFATVRSSSEPRSEPSPWANGRVSDQWLPEKRNRRPEKQRDLNLLARLGLTEIEAKLASSGHHNL